MTLARFLVHPVTLQTPTWTTDRWGNRVADWSDPDEVDEVGWFTREISTEMTEGGREAVTSEYSLTLPPDSVIDADMRVVRAGVAYGIVGDIERAESPDGTHHLTARLRSVRG